MKSILRFDGYNINKMLYIRNTKFWDKIDEIDDKDIDLTPKFEFLLIIDKTENYKKAVIKINTTIGNEEETVLSPFYVAIEIEGKFQIEREDITKEEIIELVKYNGTAILYPYLRSIVTDITSKGEHQPIILPTMNIGHFVDSFEKSEKKFIIEK